jgi:hypothetical protein
MTSANILVEFEILTAVAMKSSVFWDITPSSLFKVKTNVSKKNVASIFRVEK